MSRTVSNLTNCKIIGFTERTVGGDWGTPILPGGTCQHCFTGIRYAVIVEDPQGNKYDVGRTCALKVGITKQEYWEAHRNYKDRLTSEQNAARFAAMPKVTKDTMDPEEWEAITTAADAERGDTDRVVYWVADKIRTRGWVKPEQWEDALTHALVFEEPPMTSKVINALFDLEGNLLTTNLFWGKFGPTAKTRDGQWFNRSQANNGATEVKNNAKKGFYVGLVEVETHWDTGKVLYNRSDNYEAHILRVVDHGDGVDGVDIPCQQCGIETNMAVRHQAMWMCPSCKEFVAGL